MSMLETDQLSDLEQENSAVASETSEGDHPDNDDAQKKLKLLRLRNVGRVIIGYLNINSIRNRFEALRDIIAINIDIFIYIQTNHTKLQSDIYTLNMPFTAGKDTGSSSFHCQWHLHFINNLQVQKKIKKINR